MEMTAITTRPFSYYETFSTFRAAEASALRTGLRRKRFVHFHVSCAVRNRLIAEHVAKGRPASIVDRLRHAGPGEPFGVDIANGDQIKVPGDAGRGFVQVVPAPILDLGVDLRGLALLPCSLRRGELFFQRPVVARVFDHFARRQGRKVLQPKVDTNSPAGFSGLGLWHFQANVQVPVTTGVLAETGAVFEYSTIWNRAGHPDSIYIAREEERVAHLSNARTANGYPSKGSSAAIAQSASTTTPKGLRKVFANRVYGHGVQPNDPRRTGCQFCEIKVRGPLSPPHNRFALGVVAEVPNEVNGARVTVKAPRKILYPISVNNIHE